MEHSTIAAIATAPGAGGIAVVRLSGPESYAVAAKLKAAGFDTFITTEQGTAVTVKKSVQEIAREVVAGKWGNGEERKKKLIAAGYDYSAVQAAVNALMG